MSDLRLAARIKLYQSGQSWLADWSVYSEADPDEERLMLAASGLIARSPAPQEVLDAAVTQVATEVARLAGARRGTA